jgi:Nif-specific regulatory protein
MDQQLEIARLRREKRLYQRLLELETRTRIEPFLAEALEIVVDVTEAAIGYLEIYDPGDPRGEPRSITYGVGPDEAQDLRERVSRGIIAQAMTSGCTVDTPSALLDPRFSDRDSVVARRIPAVLCVPIGTDPPCGALYLQGPQDAEPFTADAREIAEAFAQQIERSAGRLLASLRAAPEDDPTRPCRERLRADALVGRSAAVANLLQDLLNVSPIDVGILLTGDSGTGKSLVARIIHENGPRKAEPFVELNCAAVPEALLESELFGAMAGAHSTATRRMAGKIDAADRGTLFLDEISELRVSAQSKLLQLLQSKTYYPLGASEPHHANVRIIAATNADLEAAVAEGRFREDLYYRLHVLPVRVPSLAERVGDIPLLAEHFIGIASQRYGFAALPLSPGALHSIETAEWPGNVRQLEHAVEAAVIRANGGSATQIERSHLFPKRLDPDQDAQVPPTFQEATQRFQRDLVSRTLDESGWNVTLAAERLDIARSHLYKLIRAFGLARR